MKGVEVNLYTSLFNHKEKSIQIYFRSTMYPNISHLKNGQFLGHLYNNQ